MIFTKRLFLSILWLLALEASYVGEVQAASVFGTYKLVSAQLPSRLNTTTICSADSIDPLNSCSLQQLDTIITEQVALRDDAAKMYIDTVLNNIESRCTFYYVQRDEVVRRVREGWAAQFNEKTLDRCVQDINQFRYYNETWGKVPGYEDVYAERDAALQVLDETKMVDWERAKKREEVLTAFRNGWTNRFLSRYPEISAQIKASAEAYNKFRQRVIDFTELRSKKATSMTAPPATFARPAVRSTSTTVRPRVTQSTKPAAVAPSKSVGSGSKPKKTLVRMTCELRQSGVTSNWSGPMYIYTTYKYWSDGSRTFGPSGAGYANQLPAACL